MVICDHGVGQSKEVDIENICCYCPRWIALHEIFQRCFKTLLLSMEKTYSYPFHGLPLCSCQSPSLRAVHTEMTCEGYTKICFPSESTCILHVLCTANSELIPIKLQTNVFSMNPSSPRRVILSTSQCGSISLWVYSNPLRCEVPHILSSLDKVAQGWGHFGNTSKINWLYRLLTFVIFLLK